VTEQYPDEKRAEYRIRDSISIIIETISSPDGKQSPANVVVSKTIDMSANGVQVVLDHPLPLHSILSICIDDAEKDQRFRLQGEVMWESETAEQKRYLVGFKLIESRGTDIREWKEYIASSLDSAV
jgi:hypothetical protein